MWSDIVLMLFVTVLQNASFTLVSRARNSKSLFYHGIAATLSNGMYLLVLSQLVTKLDSTPVKIAYLIGSVIGSVLMHWTAMKYFEKKSS